jgi:transcriptional regulator with XRE-family HTH domain
MSSLIDHYLDTMTQNDSHFFEQLGRKVATLRKEQRLTQMQLAEILGISQQHMASFEKGIRKIPSSMLPTLAQVFGTSADELLGVRNGKRKRGPAPKLQRQIEQIQQLPRTQQRFVMQMLDTVLQQAG